MQRRLVLGLPALMLAPPGHAAMPGELLASGHHVLLMRQADPFPSL